MKKILFALLCLGSFSAYSQTADDIAQQFIKKMGGLDAFNKITTVKMTGNYSVQGNDLPMTVQIINGKAARSDIDFQGASIVTAIFNGKGWTINPLAGATTATEVAGTALNDLKAQANVANALIDYKAKGHQIVLDGEETVEGVKTYKIKLTNKDDGRATTYFIVKDEYTLLKNVTNRDIQGQSTEVETWFSDLKEYGGVKFFMSRESKIGGEVFQSVKFDKIEVNVPIDEKIFAMP